VTPELLAKLVAFPTVSRDANEEMVRFIAGALEALGGRVRVLPGIFPGKYNLLASFGPDGAGGIVLSGHSDVVPVDGQDWSRDPFALTARDDKLFARGASDMKGFIACAMAAAARAQQKKLAQPLHIAISHDEETGCIGVRSMLASMAAEGFAARFGIIGEPTGMRVAVGHKGKIAGCICCKGEAAHSANPELGCNAIYLATDMVQELRALQAWLQAHGARDAAYAVPYSTVHVGVMKGGTALNIVPDGCDVEFEFRLLSGDAPAALLERLTAKAASLTDAAKARGRFAQIDIIERNRYPGLDTKKNSEIVTSVMAAGAQAPIFKAGFGSEAGLFEQMVGLPSVVCGPGSIDRAHKPDEFITRAELAACDAFLDRMVELALL
jgi:acetylornithine deacetylase